MPFDGNWDRPTVAGKALELLGPNGENWISGSLVDDGRYCIAGAYATAAKAWDRCAGLYQVPTAEVLKTLSAAVVKAGAPKIRESFFGLAIGRINHKATVYEWNDAGERTWPEIRRALEILRAEELAVALA